MANSDRQASRRLAFLRALEARPFAFSFYQTLRRLDCLDPSKPRLGESTKASQDPVRLGQQPSLRFAPSELHSFEQGKPGSPPRLTVLSFGLFGPNGPLPLHLTDWAQDRLRRHDRTLNRFLDLFHHRFLSLFYRAWANAQPTANMDRPGRDRFQVYVGSLFGFGMPTMRGRDEIPDETRLSFAGRFACQTRNPEGLEEMLGEYLGVRTAIVELMGVWLEIPADERWRLGAEGGCGRLGQSANLGSRVWDLQQKFRVVVGPVTLRQYEGLLPGQGTFAAVAALVRSYAGCEMEWDVNVVLKKEEIPRLRLGSGSRLGWTSWLAGAAPTRDAADPILDPTVRAHLEEALANGPRGEADHNRLFNTLEKVANG